MTLGSGSSTRFIIVASTFSNFLSHHFCWIPSQLSKPFFESQPQPSMTALAAVTTSGLFDGSLSPVVRPVADAPVVALVAVASTFLQATPEKTVAASAR